MESDSSTASVENREKANRGQEGAAGAVLEVLRTDGQAAQGPDVASGLRERINRLSLRNHPPCVHRSPRVEALRFFDTQQQDHGIRCGRDVPRAELCHGLDSGKSQETLDNSRGLTMVADGVVI